MFGYKRKLKKELNKIWTEIYKQGQKIKIAGEWIGGFDERLAGIQDEIKQIEINYGDTIHNHSVFKEKIEKAIPTYNKNIEKLKKLEENMNKIYVVIDKIVQEIDPEYKKMRKQKREKNGKRNIRTNK